jgi:hypothetical protein
MKSNISQLDIVTNIRYVVFYIFHRRKKMRKGEKQLLGKIIFASSGFCIRRTSGKIKQNIRVFFYVSCLSLFYLKTLILLYIFQLKN